MKRIDASVLKPRRKDKTIITYRFAFAFLIASMTLIISCAGTSASTATNQMQDQIQLKLLGGDAGDLVSELVLSAGTSSLPPIELKECAMFPLSYEVLVGGNPSTATYTLAVMSDPAINSYTKTTYNDVSLILSEGSTEIETFTPLTVTTAECRTTEAAAALSGAGIEDDPYIINNDRKLNLVARLVNANTGTYKSAHYRVTSRIDLGIAQAPWSEASSGSGFAPIGTRMDTNFAGTFDCEANDIVNLYVNRGDTDNVGLFGFVSGATIRNCALTVIRIRGSESVGGLVGRNNNSTISNSYVTGGDIIGYGNIGGLVGLNENSSVIDKSYATVPITGINKPGISSSNLGGLVGSSANAAISNSYATGSISSGSIWVGGLVGRIDTSTIGNSYAIGSVGGDSSVGGLIGGMDGGASMISASYWNTETSRQSTSAGGTGQTTMNLQSATSYSGWLDTVWQFAPNDQYPRLKTVACANRQYITPVPTTCTGL
ncbi:hypothetical protein COTS27_01009 [Spirochaetota bacterium]|nr:hypothetical protein COTS27_01009 [Spirochaetota bacterium]